MTSEQVKGLLQMQSGLQSMVAQFSACRKIIDGCSSTDEGAFIREDLNRLSTAIELVESEAMAVAESFTQKLIVAIAGDSV